MEGRDVPTIVAWLAPVYGLTADAMAAEIVPFVAMLEEANLIIATPETASSDGAAPPPWLAELSPVYAQPLLETYTEMQDLLLLDPIHDVGEAGWPSLPEAPKKES
jgi:hypothetical protein